MRKLKLVAIILIFSVAFTGCKIGQNKKDNVNFDEIAEEYFFPEEIIYNQSVGDVIPDRFYPIGWSKNGNFAYIIEPADEGLGNYMMGVVVISLISDEVIWDWWTEPGVDEELYREEIWKDNYDEFKENLNEYGIIQQRDMELLDDYFVYDKQDFILRIEVERNDDNAMGIETVALSKTYLKSPQLGEKLVAEKIYEESMILGQQVVGCFVSPYEERIAIVIKSERWGWEGPPNIVEYEIIGSNLLTGFQPLDN